MTVENTKRISEMRTSMIKIYAGLENLDAANCQSIITRLEHDLASAITCIETLVAKELMAKKNLAPAK